MRTSKVQEKGFSPTKYKPQKFQKKIFIKKSFQLQKTSNIRHFQTSQKTKTENETIGLL